MIKFAHTYKTLGYRNGLKNDSVLIRLKHTVIF